MPNAANAQLARSEFELFADLDAMPAPTREKRGANPFHKQFGLCACGPDREVRIYWCHICHKGGLCWDCFKRHKD